MTYTEDQVVEEEEDAEKEAEESETEVPVTELESDSKDEGDCGLLVCVTLRRGSVCSNHSSVYRRVSQWYAMSR